MREERLGLGLLGVGDAERALAFVRDALFYLLEEAQGLVEVEGFDYFWFGGVGNLGGKIVLGVIWREF